MKKDDVAISQKTVKLTALQKAGFHVKKFVEITEKEVSEIISKQQVPQDIINNILKELAIEPLGVAVRSAAMGEDGENLAWPGQFKTLLQIHTQRLSDAILECANAQNDPKVKAYAEIHKVRIPQLKLFVQEMVDAEYSGVSFTINPITGSDEILIESVLGLCDNLVNGWRQSTSYSFDRQTGKLIKQENHGNEEENALPTDLLFDLLTVNKAIHELFGKPQDTEWAIERGSKWIFINQSRDITGVVVRDMAKIREGAIQEIEESILQETTRLRQLGAYIENDILSDQNIAELLTPHPCQMAFGLFTYIFAHGNGAIQTARNEMGYQIGEELKRGFFQLVGGQPRCSIVHDSFTYRIQGIPLKNYLRVVDHYLQRIHEDATLANYPELVLYEQNPSFAFLVNIFSQKEAIVFHEAYGKFFTGVKILENQLEDLCLDGFLPSWDKKMKSYKMEKMSLDVEILSGRFQEICDALRVEACSMFVKVARLGFFALARLNRLLTKLFGEDGERYSDVLTVGIRLDRNPNLLFSIQLAKLKKGTTSLQKIIEEFGHLSAHELEISVPRYREQEELLKKLAEKISEDDIIQAFQNSSEQAQLLKEKLLVQAGCENLNLEREILMARTYLSLREMVKFAYLRAYDLLRNIAVCIERILQWDQGLIFHLDPKEVFVMGLQHDYDGFRELAQERRTQREENRSLYVPSIITSEHLEIIGGVIRDSATIFRGIGVTNFITEGRVVVVSDLSDVESIKNIHSGAILVTITTDPGWSPVLAAVGREGALVTEIGGKAAHGAIYAREVGMAAVLNVPNAARILKTGMKVRVNGPQNCVEILEES